MMKKIATYAGIVLALLLVSYAFVPEVLGGKIVNQSDISGWKGMAQETIQWNRLHPDDKTAWSDSMFGGMPNVTILDDFDGDWTKPIYKAFLAGPRPASYIFIALLGAFLMMLAFGMDKFVALAGAVAVAFCAYNFQIIQVGHNTKMQAIAFAPWAIAAMVFTYRAAFGEIALKKTGGKLPSWLPLTVLGAVLFAFALSFQIKANHVQITWYLALVILIYGIATLVWVLLKSNRHLLVRFASASALLLSLGIVGIGTNANKLIPTADYAPFTMRGGSELAKGGDGSKGLDLEYATAWSYGIEETPNLLIANFNGGSSNGSLGEHSATWQLFKRAGMNARQICKALPLYWGPQPFTAGPMYMGAISIFLFVMGLCLVKGREKWWLLACTVLAVMLAWGNHFMWFTRLFFEYAPMYNKFRTVSMALVVLQFCLPLLGFYTLDRIVREDFPHRDVVRATWISFAVTGGFCALAGLFPGIAGDFTAASDSGMQGILVEALQQDREHLLKVDAWRSFLLICVCAATIVWCFSKPDAFVVKGRLYISVAVIGVLVLGDMWSMGKRFLNSDHFVRPRDFAAQFQERPVDRYILEDESVSYRVLDLSENTFNSSLTSYRHKSIGGYSPAKMQRYQDLIDRYIAPEIRRFNSLINENSTLESLQKDFPYLPVVSMLNGKYVIVDGDMPALENPFANGPCWFAKGVVTADNANDEIALLGAISPDMTAVMRREMVGDDLRAAVRVSDDPSALDGCQAGRPETDFVQMTSYAPNELHYSYRCSYPSLAVFSEIYHPDWKLSINGQSADLLRADWVLRAALLPAGEGEIVMRYEPSSYTRGRNISLCCSILLLLLAVGSVATLKLV